MPEIFSVLLTEVIENSLNYKKTLNNFLKKVNRKSFNKS